MADQTFFDTIKKSFVDVPVSADNQVSTSEFLEATESLLALFGTLLLLKREFPPFS